MADGVAITAGSGTTIATDDNGSSHEQVMKLDLGANSTFTGYVGGESVGNSAFGMYSVPRTAWARFTDASSGLSGSPSYTAGDQVGTIQNIASVFRTGALTGLITGALITDRSDVAPTTGGYDIYFWYQSVTLAADNAAGPGVSDSDLELCVAKIEMPAFRDEGNNRLSSLHSIAVPIASADTSLYYSYVTRVDHSAFGAATDLQLTIFVQQG